MLLDDVIDYFGYDKLSVYENDEERQVSNQGISLVMEILGTDRFPSAFPRQLVTNQGKFAGRVEKWARGYLGKKLSSREVEMIGQIADKHSIAGDIHYFDFSEGVMRWWEKGVKNGVFRPSGSCYYGGEGVSIPRLESLGTISFRLFQPGGGPGRSFHDHFTGMGRAWLTPYKDCVIASNLYLGSDGSSIISPLLAKIFSMATEDEIRYKKIGFSVRGAYINGESGYAFYRATGSEPINSVHLEGKSSNKGKCICGNPLYWSTGSSKYCNNCGSICGSCGSDRAYFNMKYITDVKKWYCESCASKTFPCRCGRVYARAQSCSCGLE